MAAEEENFGVKMSGFLLITAKEASRGDGGREGDRGEDGMVMGR